MSNINPFKMISNIESGIAEFNKMSIKGAIGAALIYVIVLSSTGILFLGRGVKSSLLAFIINSVAALFVLYMTIALFYWWYATLADKKDICEKDFKRIRKKFAVKNIFYLTIAILGVRIISSDLVIFILNPFSKVLVSDSMLNAFNEISKVSYLIYVCITGPAAEEFVFRGVILGGLLKKYSAKTSIIISSLMFGIVHLNGIQFINAFLLGVFIGYIYIKTKSISICMYSHIIFNTTSYIYLPGNYNLSIIILLAVVGAISIIYGTKKFNNIKIV